MKTILSLILMLLTCLYTYSDNIERQGNNFIQTSSTSASVSKKDIKTEYTFTDKKGNKYTIHLSSSGKAYIKKTSKKTGKEYKQYVPEVGKLINPTAYKETK